MKKLLLIMFLASAVMGQVNHTGWPLELLSWNVDKAYPGIEYNYRLGVKGGEYPYRFALRHGPTGMTVDSTGTLIWNPSGATTDSVRVVVRDQLNDSLVIQYNITATTTNFRFVATTGDDANAGTEAAPWATMAYASATADSSMYVYIKAGTYVTDSFTIRSTNCGRFLAYPGDTVIINSTAPVGGYFTISINAGTNKLFQGITFNGNDLRWLFSIGSYTKNAIWRNNNMYNIGDGGSGNPAGMFFWDGGSNPVTGGNSYDKIVVQDNTFYDINGSSIACFDVKNLLFENNIVSNIITGNSVNDKDNGYFNTFRGNLVYNCLRGIVLMTQGGQSNIEVCYNHIYGIVSTQNLISIGQQNGYITDVFIHHNTVLGCINFYGYVVDSAMSGNINVYKNIFGHGTAYPNLVSGVTGYVWPANFHNKVSVDSNIVYGVSDGSNTAGNSAGINPRLNLTQWRDSGQDLNSLYSQLTYDADSIPILSDSLLNIYGHLATGFTESEPTGATPATITQQPVSDTVTAGQSATFFVTATGTDLTYQWFRNDSLVTGATNDTFTYTSRTGLNYTDNVFCALTTDTTINTNTVNLTVNGVVFKQGTDTTKIVCGNNVNVQSWQWYKNNVAISGAIDSVLTITTDSTSANKRVYHCVISNGSNSKKVGEWTITKSGTKRNVSRKNKY